MELDGGRMLNGIQQPQHLGPAATLQSRILGLMNGGRCEEMAALLPRFSFRHWHWELLAKMLRACRCRPAELLPPHYPLDCSACYLPAGQSLSVTLFVDKSKFLTDLGGPADMLMTTGTHFISI